MRHQAAARTTFYDAALERHLDRIGQLVILGAGFDTRLYRLTPVMWMQASRWKSQASSCGSL